MDMPEIVTERKQTLSKTHAACVQKESCTDANVTPSSKHALALVMREINDEPKGLM